MEYKAKSGVVKRTYLFDEGFKNRKIPLNIEMDALPVYEKYRKTKNLAKRLLANACELCGMDTETPLVYQVKKLKELSGSTPWEQKMLEIRRKTLVVCQDCFKTIESYRISGEPDAWRRAVRFGGEYSGMPGYLAYFKVKQDGQIVNKAAYMVIGIDLDGNKDVLGIWIDENESAKFWLSVLNELRNLGVQDILIASVDNLTGSSDAISACTRIPKYKNVLSTRYATP